MDLIDKEVSEAMVQPPTPTAKVMVHPHNHDLANFLNLVSQEHYTTLPNVCRATTSNRYK